MHITFFNMLDVIGNAKFTAYGLFLFCFSLNQAGNKGLDALYDNVEIGPGQRRGTRLAPVSSLPHLPYHICICGKASLWNPKTRHLLLAVYLQC